MFRTKETTSNNTRKMLIHIASEVLAVELMASYWVSISVNLSFKGVADFANIMMSSG